MTTVLFYVPFNVVLKYVLICFLWNVFIKNLCVTSIGHSLVFVELFYCSSDNNAEHRYLFYFQYQQ